MDLILKKTTETDLEQLFIFQTDEMGVQMAAFTAQNPNDREAYMKKWLDIVNNPTICFRTVFLDDTIVGSVIHFNMGKETHVSYWIDRAHWGKGIATKALELFLKETDKQPLYAMVAFDNLGSQKVLEKNGFIREGKASGFANARGQEIVEYIYKLH